MLMSCPDCMKNLAPWTWATFGRSRWITWSEVTSRWSCGFSWMKTRPVFSVGLKADAPPKYNTPATAGSCLTTSASWWIIPCIFWKEVSCRASAWPKMKPVSCCGKNPFGMVT